MRATELFDVVDGAGRAPDFPEPMVLRKLALKHFRNVPLATLEFSGRRQFLVGSNGQGKTNLLEAAGFLTALRSFRTTDSRNLIAQGEAEAMLSFAVDREGTGGETVAISIRADGKGLFRNEKRVTRLADHLGQFPTVVFSSEDLQLVRGSPQLRRRWLDLTLSAMDPGYLAALQAYGSALSARNSLLRRRDPSLGPQLVAFERALAPAGARIVAIRTSGVAELASEMTRAYACLTGGEEEATLTYEPASPIADSDGFLAILEKGRARDIQMGTSCSGPHRDELRIEVRGSGAKDFASEGQQRSTVLALRLAQSAWFMARSRVRPVLLADDVLGELDEGRRGRFWSALDAETQVIATGTSRPPAGLGDWQVFSVAGGAFTPEAPPMKGPD